MPTQNSEPTLESELILALVERLPRVFFKLKAFGDRVWAPLGITTSERGLLTDLAAHSELTAPQLAALRPVSRQAVQPLLHALAARGLIATRANPRKGRSPFYVITRKGNALLKRGHVRERSELAQIGPTFGASELRHALDVLERTEGLLSDALAR